jgi:hypothetical protein
MRRKRRPWIGFALFAVLAALAVFVLHGPLAGIVSFVAFLTFLGACINALRQPGDREAAQRTGVTGWLGNWL